MDVAGDVNEWQNGRYRLGNQTRPNTNHPSALGARLDLIFRLNPVSVSGKDRHSETIAKDRIQLFDGGSGLFYGRHSSV